MNILDRLNRIGRWILFAPKEDPKTGELSKPERDEPEEHEFVNTNHPYWPWDVGGSG